MSFSQNKLNDVRLNILSVFPKSEPPDIENLTEHICEECNAVKEAFSGVKWWEATDTLIEHNFDKLPLLTPTAFHYYFPAYLSHALENFIDEDDVFAFTLYSLSPVKKSSDDLWYSKRIKQFTQEQVDVIVDFLKCILGDESKYRFFKDAERGLRKFWATSSLEQTS